MLGGSLCIIDVPNVQPCCTLWISASYNVFVYDKYKKSRLFCVWLSDLDLSRHRPFLGGAAPAIQRVRMAGVPPKTVNWAPWMGAGGFDTICTTVCNRYDSSTDCMQCRLEPSQLWSPYLLKRMYLIENVQRAFTKHITGLGDLTLNVWRY